MRLNDVLQAENERLREEVNELRTEDVNWYLRWWNLWNENINLWEVVDGMACPWYGSGIETCEM